MVALIGTLGKNIGVTQRTVEKGNHNYDSNLKSERVIIIIGDPHIIVEHVWSLVSLLPHDAPDIRLGHLSFTDLVTQKTGLSIYIWFDQEYRVTVY